MFDELVGSVMQREKALEVSAQSVVSVAAELMARERAGAVLVVEGTRLVGILTERDIVMRVVAAALEPRTTPVTQVMTPAPITVDVESSFGCALLIMQEGGFRHLPVVQQGELVGIVSSRSAMDPALEEFVAEAARRKHFQALRTKSR
jgi:CBS domain-containing protein